MKLDKKITILLLLLIMFFSLLIRLPYLNVPLERDEGGYAYIAWRIEQGEISYKDVFDNKPPGIYYLYLLIFKIFGKTISDIHLFMYIYTMLEIFLIYKLGKVLFNKPVGLISALIFSVITMEPGVFGSSANTEIFMLLPIIASIVLLLPAIEKKKLGLFFICGLLSGIAFMIKQVAMFNFIFIIIFLLYRSVKDKKINELTKIYFHLVVGFMIVQIPVLIYFWGKGAVKDFIYWTFLYNFDYMAYSGSLFSNQVISIFIVKLRRILIGDWIFWLFCFYAYGYLLKLKKTEGILLMSWFIFSLGAVSSGRRFYPHYFLQITPPIALGAGWGLWEIFTHKIKKIENINLRKIILFIVIFLIILVPAKANYKYLLMYSPQQISRELYGTQPFVEAEFIANYINQNSSENDSIAIIGSEPEILFYAKRKSATKYIFFHHIFWRKNIQEVFQIQNEVIQEITKNSPKYLVLINLDVSIGKNDNAPGYLFEKMRQIIKDSYYLDGFVLMKKEHSQYIFGKEQVELFYEYLWADFVPILIYRRKNN